MKPQEIKKQVIAKLTGALGEIEDALRISTPGARYDPVVVPEGARGKLSAVQHSLMAIIQVLEQG